MSATVTSAPSGRNIEISIVKGLAIILMVIGHAEAPTLLHRALYTFHMPVFFMAAGYFFSRKAADNPASFIGKRFKGLYWPCVKYAIIFLLLHNIFFHFGILNETYGNWTGGVTHPYTWHDLWNRLADIIFAMSSYDEFTAGAFWFFRALFLASLGYLGLHLLFSRRWPAMKWRHVALCVMGVAVVLIMFRQLTDVRLGRIPVGGYRDSWALFFYSMGVLYHEFEDRLKLNMAGGIFGLILIVLFGLLHLNEINNNPRPMDWTLPLTGLTGWCTLKYWASFLSGRIASLLAYIGNNTLPVFVFHIIAFKAVSLIKIAVYDLDPLQIGCHMVIHDYPGDGFWVLYTIAGVGLPLAIQWLWRTYARPRLSPVLGA